MPRSTPRPRPRTIILAVTGFISGLTEQFLRVPAGKLFPTRIQFTGLALAFNISFTIFSGVAPLVATTMIARLGSMTAPAALIIGCGTTCADRGFWTERFGDTCSSQSGARKRSVAVTVPAHDTEGIV